MTTMSMPSHAARGGRRAGMRVDRLTVAFECADNSVVCQASKSEAGRLLPFRTHVTILSEAMIARRPTLIALGLLLPR